MRINEICLQRKLQRWQIHIEFNTLLNTLTPSSTLVYICVICFNIKKVCFFPYFISFSQNTAFILICNIKIFVFVMEVCCFLWYRYPGFVSLVDDICGWKAQYAAEEPETGLSKSRIENFQFKCTSQPQCRRVEADFTRSDTLKKSGIGNFGCKYSNHLWCGTLEPQKILKEQQVTLKISCGRFPLCKCELVPYCISWGLPLCEVLWTGYMKMRGVLCLVSNCVYYFRGLKYGD